MKAPAPILLSVVLTYYAYISHNNYTLTTSESNAVSGQWSAMMMGASFEPG